MSAKDARKVIVPKFSSFQPKPSPAEPQAQQGEAASTEKDRERSRNKDHSRRRRRDRQDHPKEPHHSPKKYGEPRQSPGLEPTAGSETKPRSIQQPNAPAPSDEVLFLIDKRGDPLITKYGTNDRASIPTYYRRGGGRVKGTEGFLTIHRDGMREEFSIRRFGDAGSSFRDRNLLHFKISKVKPVRVRVGKSSSEEQQSLEDEEYLPLQSRKRRKLDYGNESGSGDERRPMYRSIHGKARAHEFSDSDLDYGSDSSNSTRDENALLRDDPLRVKSIEMSKRVKDNPGDVASWLELIRHQDALLQAGADIDHNLTEGEVNSFADIKISMYESALPHAKTNKEKEQLLLGLMREGNRIWSTKVLTQKWAGIEKKYPDSFALWKARLDFELMNISTFQYQEIIKLHFMRLQLLSKECHDPSKPTISKENRSEMCSQMIYLFLRTTRLAYEAGYRELAVAAWQGILELHFARPPSLTSIPSLMGAFRDFWESDVSRIGETDAQGWRTFFDDADAVEPPEPRQFINKQPPESRDVYKMWASAENACEDTSRIPARATDEGIEDDPFRVVMYTDIEPFLFIIPSLFLTELQSQLVDAYLLFCRLPVVDTQNYWTRAGALDPFIAGANIRGPTAMDGSLTTEDDRPDLKRHPNFLQYCPQILTSPDNLFPGQQWFNGLARWTAENRGEEEPLFDLQWILNTVKYLVQLPENEALGILYLALDASRSSSNIKETAKWLIKSYPSTIELYNAYGLAEWSIGNIEVARRIIATAASLVAVRYHMNHSENHRFFQLTNA
jgi:hypothetical protein